MPGSRINHSFESANGLQKDFNLFVIKFDSFGEFTNTLNHLQLFSTSNFIRQKRVLDEVIFNDSPL